MYRLTIDQCMGRLLTNISIESWWIRWMIVSQQTDWPSTGTWSLHPLTGGQYVACWMLMKCQWSLVQVLVIYLSSVGVSADDSRWLPIHCLVCVKHMKQTLILTSLIDYLTLEDFLFHKKINFIHDLWLRSCKTTSQSIFIWDLGIGRLNGVVPFSLYSCIFDSHLPPSMTALYRFYSWQSFLLFWYVTLVYISGVILKGEITSLSVLNA